MECNTRSWTSRAQKPSFLEVLDWLFDTHQIALRRGGLFETAPGPMPAGFDFARVEGMLLGLAIGDALGNTSEGLTPPARAARYGEIRDYLPNGYAGGRAVGLPSDDTQMAFWTLEQALADGELNPEHLGRRFCWQRIFGIGSTVSEFVKNFKPGIPWYQCGPRSAGNGALMRIAPVLVPHLRSGSRDLWADVALAGMLTHNDSGSTSACLAFVNMLWQLLQMSAPPEPTWWLDTYTQTARELELDEQYRLRGGTLGAYEGPLWRLVQERVPQAYQGNLPVSEACEGWYSGAYLLETVPSVLYILMRYGDNPEEAIVRAVNDTKDNDTIAAIVGAAVGALHGRNELPARWVTGLLGRTAEADDGRVFELLAAAGERWGIKDSLANGNPHPAR